MKTATIAAILAVLFAMNPLIAADLRIGIVGLDSSHCVTYTPYINDPENPDHIPGARVIAAFQGGSPDVEASYTRVERFTREIQEKWDVELVPTIEELCEKVDAVMVLSVDGRAHLEQARKVIAAGKPLFIDKPITANLREAMEIFDLARDAGVPVFSASAFRVGYRGAAGLDDSEIGDIRGVASHGPATLEPNHQDLFWYGIHATEGLFTYLGTGCERVIRIATEDTDLVVGVWAGGRVGTLRGIRNAKRDPGIRVFGTKGILDEAPLPDRRGDLVRAIVTFFETGEAPVEPEETLDIIAFMEAADISKRRGGCEVSLKEVYDAAAGKVEMADSVY